MFRNVQQLFNIGEISASLENAVTDHFLHHAHSLIDYRFCLNLEKKIKGYKKESPLAV